MHPTASANLSDENFSSDPWSTELSVGELGDWCMPYGLVAVAAVFGNMLLLASVVVSS